jgi:hypothetical protein
MSTFADAYEVCYIESMRPMCYVMWWVMYLLCVIHMLVAIILMLSKKLSYDVEALEFSTNIVHGSIGRWSSASLSTCVCLYLVPSAFSN